MSEKIDSSGGSRKKGKVRKTPTIAETIYQSDRDLGIQLSVGARVVVEKPGERLPVNISRNELDDYLNRGYRVVESTDKSRLS